jgi:hypothetical protein
MEKLVYFPINPLQSSCDPLVTKSTLKVWVQMNIAAHEYINEKKLYLVSFIGVCSFMVYARGN